MKELPVEVMDYIILSAVFISEMVDNKTTRERLRRHAERLMKTYDFPKDTDSP